MVQPQAEERSRGRGAEQALGAGAHPLSQVFFAAHGVITPVREASPNR
jgi:hypothetical protein